MNEESLTMIYKTRFDFILKTIRDFGIKFGAAIFTLSAHKNIGVSTFYRYLMHRLYGFDFQIRPNL